MPGITYNLNIPLATNSPSVDQPNMQVNTNAIDTLLAVDHVSFNATGSGQHEQITFNTNNIPGGVPTGSTSIVYTKNNLAGKPYPFFLNSQAASVAAALPFLPDLVTSGANFGFKIGAMIFNFGSIVAGNAPQTITFAVPMTTFLAATSGVGNANPNDGATTFTNPTGTNIVVRSANTNTIWYMVIGK